MKTVFDLVATFCVITRTVEGGTPALTYKTVVLDEALSPSCACAGKSVFEQVVKRLSKPHIKTEGLVRQWLHDWELRERKVAEAA